MRAALSEAAVEVYRIPRRVFLVKAYEDARNTDRSRWTTCTLQRAPPFLDGQGLCAKSCPEYVGAARTCAAYRNASVGLAASLALGLATPPDGYTASHSHVAHRDYQLSEWL